jgi:hypothetical protein
MTAHLRMLPMNSEWELLYDWCFTVNHFVLEPRSLRLTTRISFNWTPAIIVPMQHPLWWEHGFAVYNFCSPSPAHSFSCPSQTGLMTTFYFLRFETPPTWSPGPVFISPRNRMAQLYRPPPGHRAPFVALYDSQVYGEGNSNLPAHPGGS